MLYQFLLNFVDAYSFLNVFQYITFRTGLSLFTSLLVVLLIGNPFINLFSNKKILNPIRDDGPQEHIVKKIGTPTMGGVIILLGLLLSVLLWGDLSNISILFCIYITLSFGLLGALDDYQKIKHNNSSGISSKFKIFSQILLAVIGVSFFIFFTDYQEITNLYFPFFKNLVINLGWFFIPFSVFVIIGSSNAERAGSRGARGSDSLKLPLSGSPNPANSTEPSLKPRLGSFEMPVFAPSRLRIVSGSTFLAQEETKRIKTIGKDWNIEAFMT